MEERTIHLKIKVKSLVDEAKTIRKEANKVNGMVKWNLKHHNTSVVRPHTRTNLLAYGILIGTPYHKMEKKCLEAPNWTWVKKTAMNFGGAEEIVDGWIKEAKEYFNSQLAALVSAQD